MKPKILMLNRRRALALLGGAGGAALTGRFNEENADAAISCVALAGAQTEGPYWVDEMLNRSDIRMDPTDSSVRPGVLLTLALMSQEVSGSTCAPLAGAKVDIWHCDASGIYSDEGVQNSTGKKFLRGYQITDDNGAVQFTTVYPGWYSGRTVHIHVRIRTYSGSTLLDNFTVQLFFDDSITDQVFTQSPYNQRRARDTRNASDMVLTGTNNGMVLYLNLTQTSQGYAGAATIGVNLKTAAASKPVITSGGVVSAASYQAGVAPGAWVSIFGQNLAASSHALAVSDLVNGKLPTVLSGVSVQIDKQPAFLHYVSPTQINVQAPSDNNTGPVEVSVTNAAGTSDAVSVAMLSMAPALFVSQDYVAAVRSDGTIITGTGAGGTTAAAKPGDVLQLYGAGFGATDPTVDAGTVFQGSAPLANPVMISIGGVAVTVLYAGLVAAGLYQFNVTVPNLADGDHEVVAQIAGLRTQSGVLLKTNS